MSVMQGFRMAGPCLIPASGFSMLKLARHLPCSTMYPATQTDPNL